MRKKMQWEWEVLDETTSRAKVIGGWIIRSRGSKTESMVFVMDRDHEHTIVPQLTTEIQPSKSTVAKDFMPSSKD